MGECGDQPLYHSPKPRPRKLLNKATESPVFAHYGQSALTITFHTCTHALQEESSRKNVVAESGDLSLRSPRFSPGFFATGWPGLSPEDVLGFLEKGTAQTAQSIHSFYGAANHDYGIVDGPGSFFGA